jgi:pimeloyl-ACP methyl ester carboxylesterase
LYEAQDAEGLRDVDRLAGDPVFTDPAARGTDAWLRHFVDYWSGAGAWEALGEAGQASFRESAVALADAAPALIADRTSLASYRTIAAPLLVLRGGTSPLAVRRASALIAEGVPGARLETIQDAGHMGPLTHRDRVNHLVAAHVDSTG